MVLMSADAIKSFLLEGLRSPSHVIREEVYSMLSSLAIRTVLMWLTVRIGAIAFACSMFHPILRRVSRGPLLTYVGMEFGDMKLSPWKLKLTIEDVELLSSKSSILRTVILALFPSANVKRGKNHVDYPDSRVTVEKLSVKIRVGSLAGTANDGDPFTNQTTPYAHESIFNAFGGGGGNKDAQDEARRGLINMLYRWIPHVVIVVKLYGVAVEVEKAYLAPEPPSELRTDDRKPPAALPLLGVDEDLPTFYQDDLVESIKNEDVVEAERLTLFVERWIDHVVTKMKKKEARFSFGKRNSLDLDLEASGDEPADGGGEEQQTHDEKMNAWIRRGAEALLHRTSLEIQRGSIVISGAGAEATREARKRRSPIDANLTFARLPRHKRALTVVGADAITLTFSPDEQCDALFCFVGLHTKVGNPVVCGRGRSASAERSTAADVSYAWHTLIHPCHTVLAVRGVLPFVIWSVNYDHHWASKELGLKLSSTEVAVVLSPDHLHTALLHLDDYTDAMSSYNEWSQWLRDTHRTTLWTTDDERAAYRDNYARMKGRNAEEADDKAGGEGRLTPLQMKDAERRMTMHEIMSLRCFAMKDAWRIPKGNADLEVFLRSSRSSICDAGEEEGRMDETPADAPTPFRQRYSTPLHALVSCIRENSWLLSPHVLVECSAQTLHIDFPGSREEASSPSVPSSVTVSGVSFDIEQTNTLSLDAEGSVNLDSPRPFLDLSLQIEGCKWDVVADAAPSLDGKLPLFRDRSPVGIVYMSQDAASSPKHVLSLDLTVAVTPTSEPDQHLGLTFRTCNLVLVANPLPLLSAMQNLIELSDIPFQSPEEMALESNHYEDDDCGTSDASVSPLGIQANLMVVAENTRILFLVDRKKVARGILSLHVYRIEVKYESGGSKGELFLSTQPVSLCAGQIAHDQSSREKRQIDYRLMPFMPILDVNGTKLVAKAEEIRAPVAKGSNTSDPDVTTMTTLKAKVELEAQSLLFNASPSTIVALLGVVSSLEPFAHWAQGEREAREEELRRLEAKKIEEQHQHVAFQYQVLRKIFKEIDVDGSGELSEEELELVVLKLFDENNYNEGRGERGVNRASMPTADELKRERDYLLSIMDQNRSNEISFQELDYAFFRLVNKIDDNTLKPVFSDPKYDSYHGHFVKTDSFLSGPMMKRLVYFEDMREYSSLGEVYRITGQERLENSTNFAAPPLWRKGAGIGLFWDLYTSETGCTRNSLNNQNMTVVQSKLVRSLRNYEFAKFCWKTLVQPELYNEGSVVTHWLLDKDSRPRIQCGVIDLLLRHVQTEVSKGIKRRKGHASDILYDASVVSVMDNAIVRFGSSHAFANPLIEANFSQVHVNASGLLSSQTGWFVPEKDENQNGNKVDFQSSVSASYLNTKHNHMECFLEPYNSFGTATFTVFPEDSNVHPGVGDLGAASFTVHLDCPRFLNLNTSRSFFETASVMNAVMAQSAPKTFRKMIFDRDVSYIRSFWDTEDQTKSGFLSKGETLKVLQLVIDKHWKDEVAGLNQTQKQHFIDTFANLADNQEEDEVFFLDNIISAFKIYTSRCYFSGSEEILLKNNIGTVLKASTKDLEEHSREKMSEFEYQNLLSTFSSIDNGGACALLLSGKLALVTPGYKMIGDIYVSPYQTMMFPLRHRKKGSSRKRRHSNASGFSPHLTVVPKSDSLDSITLDVQTSVRICTKVPINIRIVRIGKSAGKFHKHGYGKKKMDLGRKNMISALRRVVEGAPIVYEKGGIKEGNVEPLPIGVLDSSHFHALLIQPLTEHDSNGSWREPILLTKDFLFNPTHIREVTRCHALSGIVVKRERLNVHLSSKHRNSPIASDTRKNILRRTAWDTEIEVIPFFLLANSLPFPIVVRTWQTAEEDGSDLWDEPLLPSASAENADSDDEEFTSATPSIHFRRTDLFHLSSGRNFDHYSQDTVAIGKTLRLSGVSLKDTLFLQVSQHVNATENVSFMWTNPIQIELNKMKTGVNKKGLTALPKLILDLGDNCDCLVEVSIGGDTRVPECTIYSPYWIMNKTGLKLEYRVSDQKKSYLDSGIGGLPIMIHGSKSEHTNEKYQNVSKEIAVIPLECPSQEVAKTWWDETSNGVLVLRRSILEDNDQAIVDWSKDIPLDAAGTTGEIKCGRFIFNVRIDSLAGAFHRSNLISFTPRYVVKNMLHINISILPIYGGPSDATRKASQLRQNMKEIDMKRKLDLAPGESTVLFNFHNFSRGIEKPYHFIAFRVNASRFGASFKCKWHLIPADAVESHFFGEHDGSYDTMCGILEAKIHSSDAGSILVSISHAEVPPYRIENRSSTQYIRFIQDDNEAVVFELPPMYSCAYTWDSPLGKKKLRAVAIPEAKSKEYQLEEALELERYEEASQVKDRDSVTSNNTVDSTDSDDESIETETTKDPLLDSLYKGVSLDSRARKLNKTERYRSPRKKAVFSRCSRSYIMTKVGKQKDLPCPSAKESDSGHMMMSSKLFTYTRIEAGTKILSFSDSPWLADQVQAGIMRKGGNFKSALCEVNVQGFGLYIMDDFPKEVMAFVMRDIQLQKPTGSIELTARVRHFQVDAMLPNARYPIIIQPLLLGVDRRDPLIKDGVSDDWIVPESVDEKDCFWMQHKEKPCPVFEIACSYVPQLNMMWVPNLAIFICPLKLHIDVDYILRVLGMVVNSINKYQDGGKRNLAATSHANDQLKYVTRGQLNVCLTYIEKLHIAPVYFDMELNIKSDDPDDDGEGDSSLTLHSIAQRTDSAGVAGLLSWVINVGANFAHVSPTFRYSKEICTDQYCDIFDLLQEIAKSYVMQTVKQAYKIVFSMQLLGDPSELIRQYKTGVRDLFVKTRAEVAAGGKDGVGKGVTSLIQNVVGGTAFTVGKASGGIADLIDAITTNETTSKHLKPKSLSHDGSHPDNVIDGVLEGTKFFGQNVLHGIAGVVGNPYRGAKTGTATGVAKGVVSGVTGLAAGVAVGALGFVAKTFDGIGQTTKYLDLGVIEARCRPARIVPWGRPMCGNGLAYLKGIGIRVHTVRYQKMRKRVIQKVDTDHNGDGDGHVTSKEYKRIRSAEERRKNPPRKLVSIMHNKEKYQYATAPIRPKLLEDAPGSLVLSHYAVTFEETLILRSSDLQLGDVVAISFWNYHGLKATTTRRRPLGMCKISVGDIYHLVLQLYKEELMRKETHLSSENATADSLIIPAPQECALFKPCKKQKPDHKEIFDVIHEELAAIEKSEEDKFDLFDSDSSASDSDDDSFLGGGKKGKEEDPSTVVKANERLFGSISLSFFPIPW